MKAIVKSYGFIRAIGRKERRLIPLYRFHLDEDTGKITRTVIENYHVNRPSKYIFHKVVYSYVTRGIRHDIQGCNIDKFVNWQVYSFSGDEENAKNVMLANLRMRYKKAILDTKRFATVIDKLGGLKHEEDNDIFPD